MAGLGLLGAVVNQRGRIPWTLGAAGLGAAASTVAFAALNWTPLKDLPYLWWAVVFPAGVYMLALTAAGVAVLCQRRLWGVLGIGLGAGQWVYLSALNNRGALIGASWPDAAAFWAFGLCYVALALVLHRLRHHTEQSVERFELI